jgi:oligopeptide transport system substrate-binding protein
MTDCTMYSYQVQNYTDEYNIFYGFGGLRLMTYNYTDAEWTDYIASQGGTISYE